ncbi:MAG: hypothetical protein LBG60_13635 [Bifidobacteriaceae bacterium]|nr:hypothetical protein [Bifidobacteriaceae bacterium]
MTVFVVIAAVGLLLLLLSLVVDGIGDALDFTGTGSGIISGVSIGGLIAGLGLGGILGQTMTDNTVVVGGISAVTGLLVAAIAALCYSGLQRAQGDEEDLAMSVIVGTPGTVRSVSRDQPKTGTVAVTYLGAARTMQYLSGGPLEVGDRVMVTELIDPETVRVDPGGAAA